MATESIKERDIRKALIDKVAIEFFAYPGTVIIEELCVCSYFARIDVAAINGALHGYEIKSDFDNLERLPAQIGFYDKVFDTVTIVFGLKQIKKIPATIPEWWGIGLAVRDNPDVIIQTERPSSANPNPDPCSIAAFLWKTEIQNMLEAGGYPSSLRRNTRDDMYKIAAEFFPLDVLKSNVLSVLKSRSDWRPDRLRTLSAG